MSDSKPPVRRGMTRSYRTQKLVGLEAKLDDPIHRIDTPTLYYGEHDPFSVPLNPCEACGATGVMTQRKARKGVRWVVVCGGCGEAVADPVKRPWAAALAWNSRHLQTAPGYRELPVFGLESLDPDAAFERLKAIRKDLEARKKVAGLRRSLRQERDHGGRPPGQEYQQRLEAYLQWALYGIRLIRYQCR